MAQMPFSPCDASNVGNCPDESFKMLQYIFGDMVTALAEGADPNSVESVSNILATMFGFFNSGLLIVGAILVSYVAFVGVLNTANDGEAMGKDWSSVWTTSRIVTGGALLLPTTSGYSFIQLTVMLVTLWGVGLANGVYKTGMAISVLTPDGLVSGASVPGNYYGMDAFANDYVKTAYCKHSANAIYGGDGGATIQKVAMPTRRTVDGTTETIFEFKDTNTETQLAGGRPICGVVKLATYQAQPKEKAVEDLVEQLKQAAQDIKIKHAQVLMTEIDTWVAGWPVSLEAEGWSGVNANQLNTIVKKADAAIVRDIQANMTGKAGGIESQMSMLLDQLVEAGWASAGGWYQRVGAMRGQLAKATSMPVGEGGGYDLTGLPSDDRAKLLSSSVAVATDTVVVSSAKKTGRDTTLADLDKMIPTDIESIKIRNIQKEIDTTMNSSVNSAMRTIVSFATGRPDYEGSDALGAGAVGAADDFLTSFCGMNGQLGGSLHRMKCLGDYIVAWDGAIGVAKFTINTVASTVRMTAALLSGGTFLGTGANLGPAGVVLKDWLADGIVAQLETIQSYIKPLGFYFSVALPSLPFGIFLIVVVGWLLGVLQAMIGAPLWAVMMMTPSRTFIGSQQQGLLLFLTIFLRPALSILGLFAAMLVSDPIIDFISQGFFDYRGAIVGTSGAIGWLAEFFTFANWMIAYAAILGPVLYMTYGLPQALPDVALKWIGAGITPLGETSAISESRQAGSKISSAGIESSGQAQSKKDQLSQQNRTAIGGGSDGGGAPGGGNTPSGGGGGGTRQAKPLANEQGVDPQTASPQNNDAPSGGGSTASSGSGNSAGGSTGGARTSNANGQGVDGGSAKPRFDASGEPEKLAPQRVITPSGVANAMGYAVGGALGSALQTARTMSLSRGREAASQAMSASSNQLLYGQDTKPADIDNPNYKPVVSDDATSDSKADSVKTDIKKPNFDDDPRIKNGNKPV